MNCPRCASPLEDPQARFCPTCGASVEAPAPAAVSEPPPGTGPATAGGAHCAVHPEKAAADICSRCGAFACRECLIIGADGTGVCSACYARQGETGPLPWEDRKERGVGMWRAYWQTVKLLMFQPNTAFDRVQPETGKWWDPLSFSVLSNFMGLSGTMALYAIIGGVAGIAALVTRSGSSGPSVAVVVGIALGLVALFLIAVPFSAVMYAFIGSGIVHVTAMLVGVKPRGFEATLRAFCYGQAPMFWGVVPLCSVYVYPIWQAVCVIFGIKGLHRTTGGKASAAVLLPVGLCCGLYAAMYAFAFFAGTLANAR